jgi:hypothetical protein
MLDNAMLRARQQVMTTMTEKSAAVEGIAGLSGSFAVVAHRE